MNIDFDHHPGFSTYVLLLIVCGLVMMTMASIGRTGRGLRLLNGLFGLGFFGYGLYLGVFFAGGSYLVFFKAFIVPVVLVFRTIQTAVARKGRPGALPTPAASSAPAAPQAD